MEHEKFLLHFLYQVFLQLREEGYNMNNKKIIVLTNLVHNLPLKLAHENMNEEDFAKIKDMLLQSIEDRGLSDWFKSFEHLLPA